jgi:hypothetical protein
MSVSNAIFEQSVLQQIAVNQQRTPTQRFEALCDLLDVAREMAPRGAEAAERRSRAMAIRQHDREQLRAQFKRILATRGTDSSKGF